MHESFQTITKPAGGGRASRALRLAGARALAEVLKDKLDNLVGQTGPSVRHLGVDNRLSGATQAGVSSVRRTRVRAMEKELQGGPAWT